MDKSLFILRKPMVKTGQIRYCQHAINSGDMAMHTCPQCWFELIATYCCYAGNKAKSAAKELNTANINTKGGCTKLQNRLTIKLFYFCNSENHPQLATIIIYDCVSILFLSYFLKVLLVVFGKISCKHYHS